MELSVPLADRHRLRSILLAFSSGLSVAGCHHRTYEYEFFRLDGFTYSAESALVGTAVDTLRVSVKATNTSPAPKMMIVSSACAPFNRLVVTIKGKGKEWSSEAWRPAPPRPPAHTLSGDLMACGPILITHGFSAGTAATFVLSIPVAEIRADSLAAGTYQIEASVRMNSEFIRGLKAGHLALAN